MIEIVIIGITGAVLSMIVKAYRPEFSLYIGIATVIILFLMIASKLSVAAEFMVNLYSKSGSGKSYIPILLKVLAVSYAADFTSALCKDSGESAIASKVELAGKVLIFYIAMPVFLSVLQLFDQLI